MARRVVNIDSGSGSLSSRFAQIEKVAKTKPVNRAVQAAPPPSRPVGGGISKRGQQSPRGARPPPRAVANLRGGGAPRGRGGAPAGKASRGGASRGGPSRGGRGGRGRGGKKEKKRM